MSAAERQRTIRLEPDASGRWVTVHCEGKPASQVRLKRERVVIGRAGDADINLGDETVSRRHAEIVYAEPGRWLIRDLGSRNGVMVNGRQVDEHALQPGDRISLGSFPVIFALPSSEALPAKTSPVTDAEFRDASVESTASLADLGRTHIVTAHLTRLTAFGHELLDTRSDRERLTKLCRLMVQGTFPGRWAGVIRIVRHECDERSPRVLVSAASDAEWQDAPPPLSRTVLGVIRREDQPVLASNVPLGTVGMQLTAGPGTPEMSVVGCPLRSGVDQMDVLYVVLPPEHGTADWLAVATLAAQKCELAQRAWEARQMAAVKRDLTRAREIQATLLPQRLALPGLDVGLSFTPCRWVAGDYLGVRAMPDGRVFLAVADVTGKGLPAALVGASIHSVIHTGLHQGAALGDLMAALNDYLIENLPDGPHVTMLAAAIDPATGEVESINAGHPAAIVVGAAGKWRALEKSVNGLLGVFPGPLESRRHRLGGDEMLAMYTDGWSELPDQRGKFLGEKGLADLLCASYARATFPTASDVAGHVAVRALEGAGSDGARDDLALLLVKRL